MLGTVEVRWFHPGACPAAAHEWFDHLSGGVAEEARVDHYLRIEDVAHLGVKVRGGQKLELKHLRADLGPLELAAGVRGRAGWWRKWSFALADPDAGHAELRSTPGEWVLISKRRWSHAFALSPGGAVVPIDPATTDDHCSVEQVELDMAGRHWWSVALEASGHADDLRPLFSAVAAHVFAGWPDGIGLTEHNSWSYPQWLRATLLE